MEKKIASEHQTNYFFCTQRCVVTKFYFFVGFLGQSLRVRFHPATMNF